MFFAGIARAIAARVTKWALSKAESYVISRASDWVEDGVKWVVRKATGKSTDDWDSGDKSLAYASIELPSLGQKGWILEDYILSLLRSADGEAFLKKWAVAIDHDTGAWADRARRLIDRAIIPLDLTIPEWAASVAAALGVTPDYVMQRRLSLS